jgi:hypothetical protein
MSGQPEPRATLRWHARLLLMRAIIDGTMCDCEDSYGASADHIAQACVMLGNELYALEDPRNADYFDVLTCDEDDDLASFMGAVLCEAISLFPRPNEDGQELLGICDVNARRIVGDPKYAHLLKSLRANLRRQDLRVIEGGRQVPDKSGEKESG